MNILILLTIVKYYRNVIFPVLGMIEYLNT